MQPGGIGPCPQGEGRGDRQTPRRPHWPPDTSPTPLATRQALTLNPPEARHTMSTAPAEDPTGGIAPDWLIRFTQRGEDALDALATELAARCDGRPEGIAELLDQVLHANMSQLCLLYTSDADQPLVDDDDLTDP